MDQERNRNILMLIQFLLILPLIITTIFILGNWQYIQTQEDVLSLMLIILVIGLVTAFLVSRARVPVSFSSNQHTEHYIEAAQAQTHRDVFMIPIVCPVCKTSLKLDEVKWQDQHTLLCQECHSKIDVTVA